MVIDPDAQRVLDLIRAAGRPPFESITAQQARELYLRSSAYLGAERADVLDVTDLDVPGPAGPVRIRLYRGIGAPASAPQPALVYFHGGGWTIGDLETHDGLCRHLANAARCMVIAAHYRLAPEHKFPAAVEDCEAVVRWTCGEGGALGIDRTRLAVGGDSAGGNLAAVMAHMARDGALPPLCFQLLIYPSVDQRLGQASYGRVTGGVPLTTATVRYFQENYLSGAADKQDWRASPLLARRFDGLPPAIVITAAHDPLCDEGHEYAAKLDQAGCRVTHLHFNDQPHGFWHWGRLVRSADAALEFAASRLRAAFDGPAVIEALEKRSAINQESNGELPAACLCARNG
ncbi:MAG TPA: alpha/beta hydrolase [Xanthobacteraceae bacterium]